MVYKILKNNEVCNIIVASEEFVEKYCAANGYTYEIEERPDPDPAPEPTVWDELDAAYQEGVDSV